MIHVIENVGTLSGMVVTYKTTIKLTVKKLCIFLQVLFHLTYDKFNMSFGNNRLPQPQFFSGQPQNFVPWSQQANHMFNFANQFNTLPSLPSPVFPPNLLIQQQNNYFNSTLPSPSLYMPSTHSQILSHNMNPYMPWVPRPMPVKNSNVYPQKVKSNP